MRLVVLSLAAALVSATPALANEGRVEARGGVYWSNGYTQDAYGVAAGYDFDLGENAFTGMEVSADKIADTGTKVAFGFTGRAGAKVGNGGKLFAAGGYTTEPCDLCRGAWHAGAGYEQGFANNLYGKVEYRHFFTDNNRPDSNAVMVGVGMKF
ncbi:MAG: outer membrane beta-barrel protein [Sphingomonadales bacterium]|nr:outer membrane beta-barrel protein [Sphingomonadales bacterium]